MKYPLLLFILGSFLACDPYGFGFKNNPAHVLDMALTSIINQDAEGFADVSGEEALCVYGNKQAIAYLHEKVQITSEDIKLKWKSTDRYLEKPEFVGFWSYFNSRYLIDVRDKQEKEIFAQVVVDCHYGTNGAKDDRFQNLQAKKYPAKNCRIIKVIPKTFAALPVPDVCEKLTVAVN
jgi:hypothetical protein